MTILQVKEDLLEGGAKYLTLWTTTKDGGGKQTSYHLHKRGC